MDDGSWNMRGQGNCHCGQVFSGDVRRDYDTFALLVCCVCSEVKGKLQTQHVSTPRAEASPAAAHDGPRVEAVAAAEAVEGHASSVGAVPHSYKVGDRVEIRAVETQWRAGVVTTVDALRMWVEDSGGMSWSAHLDKPEHMERIRPLAANVGGVQFIADSRVQSNDVWAWASPTLKGDVAESVAADVLASAEGHEYMRLTYRAGWDAASPDLTPVATPAAEEPTSPEFHGTPGHVCKRCGGPVYVSFNDVECIREGGCKPVAVAMPAQLMRVRGYTPGGALEDVWIASGGAVSTRHPLRDGAIAAWRAKVAR